MMTEPTIAYVDGFNFYYGLMDKGWGRYRWLDFRSLIERFIRPPQELVAAKYFTALFTHEADKLARQRVYLKALEQRGGLEIIYGVFEQRPVKCPIGSNWYKRPQEKRTDVNIATQLLADAYDGRLETAMIVCADTDLIPAVEFVKERFNTRIVLISPPRRRSDELAALADQNLHFRRGWLSQCQFPDPFEYTTRKGKPRRIRAPEPWLP